jgi:hypothetical protein
MHTVILLSQLEFTKRMPPPLSKHSQPGPQVMDQELNLTFLEVNQELHTLANYGLKAEKSQGLASKDNIKVTFAAPHQQEMKNHGKNMANNPSTRFCPTEAKVRVAFFDSALEHAWEILLSFPFKLFFYITSLYPLGNSSLVAIKPRIQNFWIIFCPVTVTIAMKQHTDSKKFADHHTNPKPGIHGIHVGMPQNSARWLIYIPSTGTVVISVDAYFDEQFLLTLAYNQGGGGHYVGLQSLQ